MTTLETHDWRESDDITLPDTEAPADADENVSTYLTKKA